jgi:predicted small lipoprotein YifL
MKKILALVLALCMILALAACGDSTPAPAAETAAPAAEGSTEEASGKTFQFEGKFEEQGEYASMLNNAFLLTLAADGTAVCDKYAFSNYDASDAATNPTYTQSYLSGTWKEVEKDGVPCLQIKLAYVDAAGNESNASTSYAYDVAGEYSFDMTYPVTPGQSYTRTATMTGKEGSLYADANAFIQAYKVEFTAPESIGQFVDEEHGATAYLQQDGTLLLYAGYDKFADGKWSVDEEGVKISVAGSSVEVANEGSTAAFSVDRTMGDVSVTYNFVCSDVTALGTPEIAEDAPYTLAMDMGGNATTAELRLGDDGIGTLKVFMDIPVTYTRLGDAVILEADGELEGYAASIWENISHAFLLNEDRSMLAIVNAWDADGLVLIALDETNMKVQFPAYSMERDGFTYTLSEDGTQLTVTAPDEETLGAFGQVWAGAGAENWTIDGNTAAKA